MQRSQFITQLKDALTILNNVNFVSYKTTYNIPAHEQVNITLNETAISLIFVSSAGDGYGFVIIASNSSGIKNVQTFNCAGCTFEVNASNQSILGVTNTSGVMEIFTLVQI